jgi:ATPase family associated with various cellular activities (AAA)/Winged helix domain, variant
VNADRWHERNAEYLSAALAWLRLRLERHAIRVPERLASTIFEPVAVAAAKERRWFRRRHAAAAQPSPIALPPASVSSIDEQLARASKAVAEAEEMTPPPALVVLAHRLGLSRFEQDVLLLCAAMELDPNIAHLCARVQGLDLPHPTFALAFSVFEEPAWDALAPDSPLRYWRLLEISQPGGTPLTTSVLRIDERIVNYLKGLNYVDDRLTPLLAPLEATSADPALPASQRAHVERIVARLAVAAMEQRAPVVNLLGPDSPTKQLVACAVAEELGLELVRLPASLLPDEVGELELLARLWQRESRLLPLALYLSAHDVEDAPNDRSAPPLARFLARSDGLVFLDSRESWPGIARATIPLDIAKPTPSEQQAGWLAELGDRAVGSPALLASQFNLNLATIHEIARAGVRESARDVDGLHERLWEACLIETRPRLDALAQRLESGASWEDLVLPADDLELLSQIADQVRGRPTVYDDWGFRARMNRGLGVTALFAGDSGTGKTLAAEVIANDLGLNLYRIDLSGVVSKYIGETEKNLRQLFDAAELGGSILFFDEADALFGKRSEVKDSHDRYANIEINYLLQRMEAYRGLAILATNMKSALDQAFMRRLRFVVNFAFPGPAERREIWERIFPAETPTDDLDFDWLGGLVLTGGSIQNVALNASFLAAHAHSPVTMPFVLEAARSEFRKLERPINETAFRWVPPREEALV